MRANGRIYHTDCFRCLVCNKQLAPGDEFALKEEGIVCKFDIDVYEKSVFAPNNSCQNITNLQPLSHLSVNNKPAKCDDVGDYENNQECVSPNGIQQSMTMMNCMPHMGHSGMPPMHQNTRLINNSGNSNNSSMANTNSSSGGSTGHRKDKTTRVRTVLNEKQLHTLRTCYGANPRPDALMKEQLVEMTGLSPRVIRVWFQNKRCKDKKKTILIKQMQEQQKVKILDNFIFFLV